MTLSRPARRVLTAISQEKSWRATAKTVEEILSSGMARFISWEEIILPSNETPRWVLTPEGREFMARQG